MGFMDSIRRAERREHHEFDEFSEEEHEFSDDIDVIERDDPEHLAHDLDHWGYGEEGERVRKYHDHQGRALDAQTEIHQLRFSVLSDKERDEKKSLEWLREMNVAMKSVMQPLKQIDVILGDEIQVIRGILNVHKARTGKGYIRSYADMTAFFQALVRQINGLEHQEDGLCHLLEELQSAIKSMKRISVPDFTNKKKQRTHEKMKDASVSMMSKTHNTIGRIDAEARRVYHRQIRGLLAAVQRFLSLLQDEEKRKSFYAQRTNKGYKQKNINHLAKRLLHKDSRFFAHLLDIGKKVVPYHKHKLPTILSYEDYFSKLQPLVEQNIRKCEDKRRGERRHF